MRRLSSSFTSFDFLIVEKLPDVCPASCRRNVDEFFPPEPKHNRSYHHRDPRHAEGHAWSEVSEEPGDIPTGNKGADVDREIKPTENFRQQMLVRRAELVADVGAHARFDAARAQRNQTATDETPH